ncbi:MAG TPA: TolC family protein [Planktothrix sp.]|jgi:cobalt-zinc-cadmium efflux system outer membrane protein
MMTKRTAQLAAIIIAATTSSLPAVPSHAQDPLAGGVVVSPAPARTLSLAQCFNTADQSNREILSARWNISMAQAQIKVASAIPNPQFQLQAGFGPTFTELFTGQTQQVQLTQQLQTAGKRSKKIEVAKANLALSQLQFDALRFDVHNRVRRAYAELAAAEAYESLIESQKAVGEKLLAIAQHRFDAGKAAKSEVLQADLNVAQFDTQKNQASGRLEQDSAALGLIVGESPGHVEVIDVDDNGLFKLSAEKTAIVPQPYQPLPSLDLLVSTAWSRRSDLKAAQQQIFVNQKALALAKVKKVPDIFVGVGTTYTTLTHSQPAGLGSVGNWVGTGGFFNITFENPILYQYQGEVQVANAQVLQSQRQYDLLKSQISSNTVVAYSEVSVARDNIFRYEKELLPTASEVARIARRGYEVGKNDLATAIVAQQQYQQTLSSFFDSVVAYQTAWSDLEKAVGVPLKI